MNKITGYSSHRLIENDEYYAEEIMFNDLFNLAMMRYPNFWDFMTGINENDKPNYHLSDSELKLLATLVQWLGTPNGKEFLDEAGYTKLTKS